MSAQGQPFGPHPLGYVAHSLALRPTTAPGPLLLACASFEVEKPNFVEVLTVDLECPQVVRAGGIHLPHYYPATRVRWLGSGAAPELLATSGDHIRIWSASGELRRLLRREGMPQGPCTPITGLDTNADAAGAHLVSCDIHGICSLWDAEHGVLQQALDLEQPLCDVAFGPSGLVTAVGERGDCFLIDPRGPQDVTVLAPQRQVRGPGRVAWGPHRPDLFAVAWQGEQGGIALYSGLPDRQQVAPQLLRFSSRAACVDLQWSSAFPERLCCADEAGAVEVWHFPEQGLGAAALATGPCFQWEPAAGRGGGSESCTALALTSEVQPGQQAVLLATMPSTPAAAIAPGSIGSLWIAALPCMSKPPAALSLGAPAPRSVATNTTPRSLASVRIRQEARSGPGGPASSFRGALGGFGLGASVTGTTGSGAAAVSMAPGLAH